MLVQTTFHGRLLRCRKVLQTVRQLVEVGRTCKRRLKTDVEGTATCSQGNKPSSFTSYFTHRRIRKITTTCKREDVYPANTDFLKDPTELRDSKGPAHTELHGHLAQFLHLIISRTFWCQIIFEQKKKTFSKDTFVLFRIL